MKTKLSMDKVLEEKLSAWLDGELSPEETQLLFDAFANLPTEDKNILKGALFNYTVIKNRMKLKKESKLGGERVKRTEDINELLSNPSIPDLVQANIQKDFIARFQKISRRTSFREWLAWSLVVILGVSLISLVGVGPQSEFINSNHVAQPHEMAMGLTRPNLAYSAFLPWLPEAPANNFQVLSSGPVEFSSQ